MSNDAERLLGWILFPRRGDASPRENLDLIHAYAPTLTPEHMTGIARDVYSAMLAVARNLTGGTLVGELEKRGQVVTARRLAHWRVDDRIEKWPVDSCRDVEEAIATARRLATGDTGNRVPALALPE